MESFLLLFKEPTLNHILYECFGILVLVLVFILFLLKRKTFICTDLPPQLDHLKPRDQLQEATIIKTGLFIKNFPVFDLSENNFVMDAIVWFKFNPSLVSLETIENFTFERAEIKSISKTNIKLEDNQLLVKYNVQVKFSTNLDHRFFPINDHKIYIALTNESVNPQEFIFEVNNSSFSWADKLHTHDWFISGKTVDSGFSQQIIGCQGPHRKLTNPKVVYSLELSRTGLRRTTIIFLPMLLIFMLGLYTLILDISMSATVFSLSAASLSGLLVYRFVIERILPNTGYFTLTEHFITIILIMSFITFLVNFLHIQTGDEVMIIFARLWFLISGSIIVISIYYLLNKWDPHKKYARRVEKKSKSHKKITLENTIEKRMTVSNLIKFSDSNEEFPEVSNINRINPEYSDFHKKYMRSNHFFFSCYLFKYFGIVSTKAWDPILSLHLLIKLVLEREKKFTQTSLIAKYSKHNFNIVVLGDLTGAFHSLIRDLDKLKNMGILNDSLEIINPDYYIVFNGNVVDYSAYIMETLTVVMQLLIRNPTHVFYLKGDHEKSNHWQNYQTQKELRYKLGSSSTLYSNYLERLFLTLPIAMCVYSKEDNNKFLCISSNNASNVLFKFKNISQYNLVNDENGLENLVPSDFLEAQNKIQPMVAVQGMLSVSKYQILQGVLLLKPENGYTRWGIFSSPTTRNYEFYRFSRDSFSILEIKDTMEQWLLSHYHKFAQKKGEFKKQIFHLLYAFQIPNERLFHKMDFKNEIRLGTTLDLSKTSVILGEHVRSGLQIGINQQNSQGGLKNRPMHLIVLDDQYTPYIARKNISTLLNQYKSDLILTPVGTPTTESFLPLIEARKILVLFPYTGANIFRKRELSHVIHFRTSYANEAKALLKFATSHYGIKRFVAFYQNDSYGRSSLDGAREIIETLGIEDWHEVPYERNNPNVGDAAKKIIEFNPSAILFFSINAPSVALVHHLGVNYFTDKLLLGISPLTNVFRTVLKSLGLKLIISRVTPSLKGVEVAIVNEYHLAVKQSNFGVEVSLEALEAYINTQILSYVLKSLEPPYNKEAIIESFERIKNIDFKGLKLNFNPETRELSNEVWIDIEDE